MSIHVVLKCRLLSTLFIAVTLISLLSISTRVVHATGGTNLAKNLSRTGYPNASASYTCSCDDVWHAVDGVYSFNRWTSYNSNTATVSYTIDFGSVTAFNQVKLFFYNDSGGVKTPASYDIEYWDGSVWKPTTNQSKSPVLPYAEIYSASTLADNILNTDNFDSVSASKVKVVFTNQSGFASGLVEIEVYLYSMADENAASAVMTQIEELPLVDDITLADKPAILAAQSAYTALTTNQQSYVTTESLSTLTDAEAALATIEASLTDVRVLSAFSNLDGNKITLKLSSALDMTYSMLPSHFTITANGVQAAVANIDYDLTDSSGHSITVTLDSPVLLNETAAEIALQSGTFRTSNNELNSEILTRPVITFKKLDLTLDNQIGIDDIVLMINNPALHMDVNQDEVFDPQDVGSLLGQISSLIHN